MAVRKLSVELIEILPVRLFGSGESEQRLSEEVVSMHALSESGDGDAGVILCGREESHSTQVLKMHKQNEIFRLIVAFEVDKSPDINN